MANNYTQAAELLDMPLAAARHAVLVDTVASELADYETVAEWMEAIPGADEVDPSVITDARSVIEACQEDIYYGTSCRFEAGEHGLYLASDESIDLDATATIVQVTMARFDLAGPFVIEWASTCSALRAGEFGGGALVITKDDIRSMSSSRWAELESAAIQDAAALDAGFQSA